MSEAADRRALRGALADAKAANAVVNVALQVWGKDRLPDRVKAARVIQLLLEQVGAAAKPPNPHAGDHEERILKLEVELKLLREAMQEVKFRLAGMRPAR